ncbi:hypothetical protein CAEBREN_20858 [Caenorhabditis brenneri]|uniref:Uncharacterized protein n=1 Tax=Caenorhabditis brenneri TaxID=135651 RepID=G0MCC6_CAEBE|nr:hypothetical protein CAEBREN_20858 [Caenorhabditis brenneri]
MANHDELNLTNIQIAEGTPYYDVLLQIIQEIGKDIRPTYTFNKSTCEKLKRHIHTAKVLIKACQTEAENDRKKADAAVEAMRIQALKEAREAKKEQQQKQEEEADN